MRRSTRFIAAIACAVLALTLSAQTPPPAPQASAARRAATARRHAAGARPASRADRAVSGRAACTGADGRRLIRSRSSKRSAGRKPIASLKDKALEDALQKQSWDPAVKSLAVFPQVLTMMSEKLDWTQKLGDAFLAQQKDVMATVQSLRQKASGAGQPQEHRAAEGRDRRRKWSRRPSSRSSRRNPRSSTCPRTTRRSCTARGGGRPTRRTHYYPPGYVAGGALLGFTAGVIVGGALWGGVNWGRGDVNVNVNRYNNFNRTNISNSNWQHNASHRGAVPYQATSATSQQYGRGQYANAAVARAVPRSRRSGTGQPSSAVTSPRDAGNRGSGAQRRATCKAAGARGRRRARATSPAATAAVGDFSGTRQPSSLRHRQQRRKHGTTATAATSSMSSRPVLPAMTAAAAVVARVRWWRRRRCARRRGWRRAGRRGTAMKTRILWLAVAFPLPSWARGRANVRDARGSGRCARRRGAGARQEGVPGRARHPGPLRRVRRRRWPTGGGRALCGVVREKHALAAKATRRKPQPRQGRLPVRLPLVKKGDRWRFDTAAGRNELLARRIGAERARRDQRAAGRWPMRSATTPPRTATATAAGVRAHSPAARASATGLTGRSSPASRRARWVRWLCSVERGLQRDEPSGDARITAITTAAPGPGKDRDAPAGGLCRASGAPSAASPWSRIPRNTATPAS